MLIKSSPLPSFFHSLSTLLLLQQQQNSSLVTNNSTNINDTCHPILFQLGSWSRESNPKLEYGLCPDSIVTPIFSGVFLFFYLLVVSFSFFGIFWKRKNGHIEFRNPMYLVMTLIASMILVVGMTLRFLIGRKIFPCGIYTLLFFVLPGIILLPTAFRCMRLFFMYRLNLQKTNIFERAVIAQSNAKISNAITSIIPEEVQKLENDGLVPTPRNPSRTNSTPYILDSQKSSSHLVIQIDSLNLEKSVETKTPRENIPKEDTSIKSPSMNASSQEDATTVPLNDQILDKKCIESPPTTEFSTGFKFEDYVSTEVTEDTTADMTTDARTTWNGDHFRDILELKSEINKFKFYKFMLSYKFVIMTYITVLCIQIIMWLIFGGVEEAVYTSGSTVPGTKRIFLLEGGMLVFERGCSMSTTMVLIIAGESVFYMLFEVVSLILCVKSDRDTWAIKKEALSLIIFQVFFVIAFVVAGLLDIVVVLTDYFIPYGYTLLFYSFLEVIVTVACPVLYAFVRDYREEKRSQYQKETELEAILRNKKMFERFLDYARRSFAPESVLCYRDIQHFKKTKSNQKRKAAQFVVNTYLQLGSPLELNIDNVNERGHDFTRILSEYSEDAKIPKSLFEELEMACLVDMRDVFTRAQVDDKEIFNAVQQWKKAQANIKLEEVK